MKTIDDVMKPWFSFAERLAGPCLRLSLGLVLLWIGATDLVTPQPVIRLLSLSLVLFAGTLTIFVIAPGVTGFPVLTLMGQFLLKDVVLASAAITLMARDAASHQAKREKVADTQPRVVIVGAGFGGLEAAKALRHAPVQVIVIDRWNHHLFQPMLYQVATAGLSITDIAAPIRSIFSKQANTSVILAEVTGVDVQGQRVLTAEKAIPYDYLILATGASSNYFGHDAWQRWAPSLKSLQDALTVRNEILGAFEAAENEPDPEKRQALLTFVLVGGGPTGVELAGAIAELAHRALTCDFRRINPSSARILLVEGEPRIIPTFPASLTHKARTKLEQFGVEVRTGVHVTDVTPEGVKIGEEYIPAKNVIWTAGVKASPAGAWLGAEVDRAGRVKVQSDLSVPGHSTIFVIGDTACVKQNGKLLPGLSPVAMQEGRYVAKFVARRVAGNAQQRPFRYVDKGTLATVGRSFAVVDIGPIHFTGFFAWLTWIAVHLFYLVGFRNRFLVLLQYAWAYVTFQPGARIILPEDGTSLPQKHLVHVSAAQPPR